MNIYCDRKTSLSPFLVLCDEMDRLLSAHRFKCIFIWTFQLSWQGQEQEEASEVILITRCTESFLADRWDKKRKIRGEKTPYNANCTSDASRQKDTNSNRWHSQIQDMWFTSFMHFFNAIMISKLRKLHFWLHVHDSTHSVYFRKTWIVRQYCCIVLDFIINNNNNNNNRC